MTLDVERDGKMFVISYAPFGIDVYSSTFKGVTKEFNEYVSELWEIYAEAEDEILSDDARNLKRRLRNTFVLRKQDDFRESSSTIPFYYHPEAMNRTFSYANS